MVTGLKKRNNSFGEDSADFFAEENEQNSEGAGDRGSEASGRTSASGGRTGKRSAPNSSNRSRRGSAPGEKETVRLAPERRRGSRARVQTVLQYIFLGLGIFFFVCLFLNLLCNFGNRLEDPSKHWMGYVGYGISYAFHGLFGSAAFLLPIGMVVFFVFWKRLREERRLIFKILNAVALLLIVSTLIHTFYLAIEGKPELSAGELIRRGAALSGGGLFGGKLAYFAVNVLNWAGAFILEFLLFFASFFYMLGMTPRYIWTRWNHRRELSGKDRKTLSEQEAEKAKRRAKEIAEEKKAQSSVVKTTPEGFPDGSVTIYKNDGTLGQPKNPEHPPIPTTSGSDEQQLYLPGEVRRRMREEDERKRQQMEEQRERKRLAEEEVRRTQVDAVPIQRGEPVEQSKPALPQPEPIVSAKPAVTPPPARTATATPIPVVSDEVRTNYESVDPIFPQTDNKGVKKVRKEDRNFDLKDIFNDEDVDEPLAPPPQQHAPLPPEKPVPNRAAPRKTPPPPAEPPIKEYVFPPLDLLKRGAPMSEENRSEIEQNMRLLATTLENFRVGVKGIDYACGPTVTRYEITPAAGVHAKSITNLASDIALAFAVSDVRMAQISGKSAIGVEVPNKTRYTVFLRNLLESPAFQNGKTKLTVALGADVVNDPVIFDITEMPHLLVGGATKMGKSVCINCTITSLLFRARPDEVKLILIDPKKVEFTPYKSIPHLLAPIITSANDAAGALQAAVAEMESRFELIQEVGAKNAEAYNEITKNDPDKPFMPYLVIIIDELADLMLQARDQVEEPICRLLQKGRASGIHLILGTQRPSVDVVTGLIKSNVPSRIACTVASQVDSRTILDGVGAEKLLGRGDMLFSPVGSTRPERVQGAFVSDKEVESVCNFIRAKNGNAVYDEKFTEKMKEFSAEIARSGNKADDVVVSDDAKDDNKYLDAVRVAMEEGKMSTSLLQRRLGLGYGRAAKLIDRMQAEGIVSPPDGSKPRSVLITADEFMERFANDEFSSGGESED